MARLHPSNVKETASNKPAAGGTFNLPDSATAPYRSFDSALATGDTVTVHASNGTAWQDFIGTFTAGTPDTLAQTTFLESSTGSAIDWSAGADVVLEVAWVGKLGESADMAMQAVVLGGRLTLESGVPVSVTDQTAKTTIYYTPYKHDRIPLWNGSFWQAVQFAETSLALGTLTASLPYDVFGYLSSGALALEMLAWTNGTTRATAVTLQDGRYCKSGDKTRLYLGTFYTTSTTTTEDSVANRFVWNVENRVNKSLLKNETTSSWTYATDTWRATNNNTANRVSIMVGLAGEAIDITAYQFGAFDAAGDYGHCGISEDGTADNDANGTLRFGLTSSASIQATLFAVLRKHPAVGFHYYQLVERAEASITFYSADATNRYQTGLTGLVRC